MAAAYAGVLNRRGPEPPEGIHCKSLKTASTKTASMKPS